jgi:hypothetical protein
MDSGEVAYCQLQLVAVGCLASGKSADMGLTTWWPSIALTMLLVSPASATLGGDAASVQADQAQMKAALKATTATPRFTVVESELPSGTLVRQYVSPGGLVFAVAWEGPSLPDLRQLLGTFFVQYVEAAKRPDGAAGTRVIQLPGLVVFSGGRMRAFLGRAYMPGSIPAGVSIDEIR